MIEEALKNKGVKFTVFQEEKLPADFHIADSFPEGNYLKVLFIKIKNSLSLLTDFLSVKILLTEIMINYKCERFTICFLYDKMQE